MSHFSEEQISEVRSALAQIRRDGLTELFLTALHDEVHGTDAGFEVIPSSSSPGVMSDGSKRRGDVQGQDEQPNMKQRPVLPSGQSGTVKTVDLPPGLNSLEDWGRSILDTGKFQKEQLTYEEIASSPEKSKQAYCSWLLAQRERQDFNVQLKDFIQYLIAMEKTVKTSTSMCYPGSTIPRKMK